MKRAVQKRKRDSRILKKRPSTTVLNDEFIRVEVERTNARSTTIPAATFTDSVHRARYFLRLQVTATTQTVYLPVSVNSGRVSTGFVYQIEGTAVGKATANVTCRGKGVTMVTLGSILYSKIPPGKTAEYTLTFTITDPSEEEYKIVISRINYKLNTNDSRYKRFLTEISTSTLELGEG